MERELHINMLNGKNSELMQTGLGVDAALLFWKVRVRAEDNHRSPLGASLPWRHAPDSGGITSLPTSYPRFHDT